MVDDVSGTLSLYSIALSYGNFYQTSWRYSDTQNADSHRSIISTFHRETFLEFVVVCSIISLFISNKLEI